MSIQQTKKQTDLEKRLKLLRTQVYGKSSFSFKTDHSSTVSSQQTSQTEVSFLYQDLQKIVSLALLAIGVQVGLYLAINNHLVKLF